MSNIAHEVINYLGGFAKVSEITGTNPATPYKWTYEKRRGGTGGEIPKEHWESLIQYAKKEKGVQLPYEAFLRPGVLSDLVLREQ